jgi:predicted peptidase
MGGMGTWAMAHAYPTLFAAIAPVCGIDRLHAPPPDPTLSMEERRARMRNTPKVTAADMAPLVNTPTYIFTGQRDPVVPVSGSLEPYAALVDAGNTQVRSSLFFFLRCFVMKKSAMLCQDRLGTTASNRSFSRRFA